jgi:hypothetical protein
MKKIKIEIKSLETPKKISKSDNCGIRLHFIISIDLAFGRHEILTPTLFRTSKFGNQVYLKLAPSVRSLIEVVKLSYRETNNRSAKLPDNSFLKNSLILINTAN